MWEGVPLNPNQQHQHPLGTCQGCRLSDLTQTMHSLPIPLPLWLAPKGRKQLLPSPTVAHWGHTVLFFYGSLGWAPFLKGQFVTRSPVSRSQGLDTIPIFLFLPQPPPPPTPPPCPAQGPEITLAHVHLLFLPSPPTTHQSLPNLLPKWPKWSAKTILPKAFVERQDFSQSLSYLKQQDS